MFERLLTIPTGDADTQRRGRTIILIALALLALLLLALISIVLRPNPGQGIVTIAVGALVVTASIFLSHGGRVTLAAWLLIAISLGAVGLPNLLRPEITTSLLYLTVPVVVAGVILRPWQVWPVLAVALLVVGYKGAVGLPGAMGPDEARSVITNSGLILLTLGLISFISAQVMGRAFAAASAAQGEAEESAQRLEQLNTSLEDQVSVRTAELRSAFSEVEARANEKQALLDEIASQRAMMREMSVPVLPVRAGTLVMPLVGDLDSGRLEAIESRALEAIEESRADTLLIDLTGVPLVDTHVAQGLMRTMQAARLLGATPVLIGIRPEVAQSIVSLGIDVADLRTAASLESALER